MSKIKFYKGNILASPYDQVKKGGSIKVEGGEIGAVLSREETSEVSGDNVIDVGDSYIFPGLIDPKSSLRPIAFAASVVAISRTVSGVMAQGFRVLPL